MSSTTLPKLKLKINVQIEAEKGHKSNITDRLSCRPLPGGSGGKATAAAFLLPPHRRLSGCRQSCAAERTAVAGPRLAHPALGSQGSCPGRRRWQIRVVPTQIWWGGGWGWGVGVAGGGVSLDPHHLGQIWADGGCGSGGWRRNGQGHAIVRQTVAGGSKWRQGRSQAAEKEETGCGHGRGVDGDCERRHGRPRTANRGDVVDDRIGPARQRLEPEDGRTRGGAAGSGGGRLGRSIKK